MTRLPSSDRRPTKTVTIKWWGCLLISFGCGAAFALGVAVVGAILR